MMLIIEIVYWVL